MASHDYSSTQAKQRNTRVKIDGKKIRKLHDGVYCGFAGSLADAFTLMEGLENIMQRHQNQTLRNCITYAKQWRTGKYLRNLQATLLVIDKDLIVELDGTGNVLEIPDVIGIGSGGIYAECAARALLKNTTMSAEEIANESMRIAADKCIYTSNILLMEKVVNTPSL
jgi:ATP-dependent HslUV protease subunit HslV